MSATPPEASSEYSKGSEAPKRGSGRSSKGPAKEASKASAKVPAKPTGASRRAGTRSGTSASSRSAAPAPAPRGWAVAATVGCALLGALLLVVAEFTTLFEVHASNVAGPIKSVSTGSNDSYALVPIALAVVVLAVGFWRTGARSALLAIGALAIVVLLISLLGDLPDAHATGLIGSSTTHYVDASSTPSAGLYLETLGAVVLLIACVCGFLLTGPPAALKDSGRRAPRGSGRSEGPPGRSSPPRSRD